ncbi:hypothetical protein HHL19_03910 [Streptomyces sp. R302]|uniref:hypothetical protein n=1 Tax=unclassified Streptomyces TaxID=2593676 RepID=UPI00145EC955|nr:hypothetical protein [Streptomyces sp. R301]NML77819.1 hypothetical protein [Streptomyces sp. R302]
MSTQDLVPSPVGPVDVEQAEAALVERYPRLVRIAYLVLPPTMGRKRRVLTAHALVQRALPRRRVPGPAVPEPRRPEDAVDPGYAYVRGEVLRQALVAGLPLRRLAVPRRAQLPPLLPQVWGLRLFPRAGGADELALDQLLARLSAPARAAYVLRGLERQGDAEVLRVLAVAGARDPEAALAELAALEETEAPEEGEGLAAGGPEGRPEGPTAGPGRSGEHSGKRPGERPDRVGGQAGPGRTRGGGPLGAAGTPATGAAAGTGGTGAGAVSGTGGIGDTGAGGAGAGAVSGTGGTGGARAGDTGARDAGTGGAGGVPRAESRPGGDGVGDRAARRRLSGASLLESAEFDPCTLQARPGDLLRRRQHGRAVLVGVVALLVCGTLLGLPGDGWGRNGAAAPSYARNPAAEAALDPAKVKRVAPAVWPGAVRRDFSVWPARGELAGDAPLLRRALAVWARPGGAVASSATPGTPVGPPMGPPQLLFAGRVDAARVVLFHDGLRIVRYAEPVEGTAGAALDFARTDGAEGPGASAVVVTRAAGNVRYLTAPWVTGTAVRDLLMPAKEPWALGRDGHGVTDAVPSPALAKECARWNTLQVTDDSGGRLLGDLGELVPARLLWGPPGAPVDATGREARAVWARTACQLTTVLGQGVGSVRAWRFARQPLPEGAGRAAWVCTRAETWRGTGSRVLAQFLPPDPKVPAALASRAQDAPACGLREPRVLAGALWQAPAGGWYVLAAGGPDVASVRVEGGVTARAAGPVLAAKAPAGARAELSATLKDGRRMPALR